MTTYWAQLEVGAAAEVILHHACARQLIDAVPSPDPDKPWDLDDTGNLAARFVEPGKKLVLHRTDPLRAVAAPAGASGEDTTAAVVEATVAALRESAA